MAHSSTRRAATLLLATLVLVATAGCQMVRAGAKCNPASGAGRDATHVLFCTNGRWKRALTIGQAAQIMFAKAPVSISAVSGPVTIAVGTTTAVTLDAKVTTLDGSPAAGVSVSLSFPSSGAGGTATAPTFATGDDGIAHLQYVGNNVAGSYNVTASAAGIAQPATFAATNTAGPLAAIVAVSGSNQTAHVNSMFGAPFIARATDRFGNALSGVELGIAYDESVVTAYGNTLVTDAAGTVMVRLETDTWTGSDYFLIGKDLPDGSSVSARFDFTIVP